ncbi:hypothetical protein HU200_024173 [Digitaria exilis]|uniref:DUF4220 domain-containing protein n=1 Tax=Digitaria exilis TaxID=1010633 RepID=A0A835C162_9POAL|nr:hypothetical protein HU200_024173 [Digitaria exilis]
MEKQGGQQAQENGTNIMHSLLRNPRLRVVSVEALVLLEIALLWFIAALGSFRRRSSSRCIRTLVWAIYTLIFLIFTYTIGFMQSSSVKNDLYPVWAVSFFAVLGCTNSITAFELDDNKQWMKLYIQLILYYMYVSVIFLHLSDAFLATSVTLLFTVTIYKNYMRIHACVLASESWYSSKLLADYMKHEADANESRYDPVSLAGYNYLVCWTGARIRSEPPCYRKQFIATENVITIEQIWHCDDRLMKSAAGARLKDVCLSFALFHLLRRRFFGFSCSESGLQKTHDFIFRGLLATEEEYDRAFRVIQVELSFLYDFFFTKYAVMYYRERMTFYLTIVSVTLTPLVILAVTHAHGIYHSSSNLTTVENKNADIVITVLNLASLALLDMLQLILYWLSDWGKVSLTCRYVSQLQRQNNKYMERMLAFLCEVRLVSSWQDKIGQYSLLESFQGNPYTRRLKSFTRWSNILYLQDQEKMGISMGLLLNNRKAGISTNVDAEVKKAIVQSLKASNGQLSNGLSSLVRNGLVEPFSWACRQETQTHTILIWHIATCYCEIAPPELSGSVEQVDVLIHHDVAMKLSRYCAYLVVFVPELLPNHQWDSKAIFDEVEKEASEFLRSVKTSKGKYQVMKNLGELEETIFVKGAKLGKQLENVRDYSARWKVIADFWSEMILFVAPSDNVRGHIERLTHGGEFITQLWALLTHAGIVEQNKGKQNV